MFTFNISIFLFTILIILTAVYFKIYRAAVMVGVIYVLFAVITFLSSESETKTGQIEENIVYDKPDSIPEVLNTTFSVEKTIEDSVQSHEAGGTAGQIIGEEITYDLEIRTIKICRRFIVEQRKPVEVDTVFTLNKVNTLFCFTGVRNTNSKIQTITHIWEYNDKIMARIAMEVSPSPFWRCWSNKRIAENQKGNWTVKIVNDEGAPIGEKSFSVN
tara:strand:+ start:2871 stop:3518 length:648 start_codon:yes stop_codon:yes gene_type:complete